MVLKKQKNSLVVMDDYNKTKPQQYIKIIAEIVIQSRAVIRFSFLVT